MDIQTATLMILALCVVGMAGILVVLVMLRRKLEQIIKSRRKGCAGKTTDLKLFDQLPKDYKDAVNHIVAEVLGDELPDMNDAFRLSQAEIFEAGAEIPEAGALKEDEKPDLRLFEIQALAFRDGWESRGRISGVPL